ncbi:MAG: hypothetical protein WAM66_06015 [Acidobacteriaceae bacterium]
MLHDDAEKVLALAECGAADVETHGFFSTFVKDPELKADRHVFLQADAKVGLAQRRKQEMENTHFAAVIGSLANGVIRCG